MRFSERRGIKSPKVAQIDSIDDALRNGLWNALLSFYWNQFPKNVRTSKIVREDLGHLIESRSHTYQIDDLAGAIGSDLGCLIESLWIDYFKKPIDTLKEFWRDNLGQIRDYFFDAKWWEVYDFVEFIADADEGNVSRRENFINCCNLHLERENSAYRFVGGKIADMISKEEIESIESAIAASTPYGGVKDHLRSALALYSDKSNPDYRNSMKESISSIEALTKKITGDDKATLGKLLKRLEKEGRVHPALKEAFSSLYGYTSRADGIRHALLEKENLTKTDARFMLVCCSAFVNFVIETIE